MLGARGAVDRVVRGHDRRGLAFDDAGPEVRQEVLAEHPLAHGHVDLGPVALFVVDGIVLQRGGKLQVLGIVALRALHVRDRHPRRQPGVLAEGLPDPSPARIAADVDDRRAIDQPVVAQPPAIRGDGDVLSLASRRLDLPLDRRPVVVDRPPLVGDRGRDIVHEARVPRRRHADRHREHRGRLGPHDAVQALVPAVHRRDLQALDRRRGGPEQGDLLRQRQLAEKIVHALVERFCRIEVHGLLQRPPPALWLPPSGGSRTPAAAFRLKPEATSSVSVWLPP